MGYADGFNCLLTQLENVTAMLEEVVNLIYVFNLYIVHKTKVA